jgi:cystathionine beta-lyase/cystathionine gamma-synthase
MKIESKAVHVGDRKKADESIPSSTPIYTATTFFYDTTDQLDKVFGEEIEGQSYSRYGNPTNDALEELLTSLESGAGTLACSSGMTALHVAVTTALMDRRKSVLAANAVYGATVKLLTQVLEPFGVETNFVDICDLDAVQAAVEEQKPGCIVMETISNPLLRVGQIDKIAEMARGAGAAFIVDNTFATPLLVRPLELGAHMTVHSLTKYLSGHGDVLGGSITADEDHIQMIRGMGRIYGPVLGPFESYMTMRGIKTFPLRMERQCRNACRLANWLASHPKVSRVHYPGDPKHSDAETVSRLLPKDLYGAMVSFDLKDAGKAEVFACMDRMKMIVRGTSLGDVHTLALYPAISSHRDITPKQRERLGIRDSLIRISVGIESIDDIVADLEQAIG